MKNIKTTVAAASCFSLLLRIFQNIFTIDEAGYGTLFTRLSLFTLYTAGLAVYLLISTKLRNCSPDPTEVLCRNNTVKTIGIIAGISVAISSLFSIVEIIQDGYATYLFFNKNELISLGVVDISFKWKTVASLLGIPGGIWMALVSDNKKELSHAMVYSGAVICLHYVFRSISIYIHMGSNPHNESAVASLISTVLVMVLCIRYCSFRTTFKHEVIRSLLSGGLSGTIITAASVPATIQFISCHELSISCFLISDLLISVFVFISCSTYTNENNKETSAD